MGWTSSEADALFFEGVDGVSTVLARSLVALVDLVTGGGGKGRGPDGRASEAVDDVDAELPGVRCRSSPGRSGVDAVGLAVAPDAFGDD